MELLLVIYHKKAGVKLHKIFVFIAVSEYFHAVAMVGTPTKRPTAKTKE